MRDKLIIGVIVIYFIGFFLAHKAVRDSCTHGNCKHGWNSKYNKTEKNIASLWIVGFPIGSYFFFTKVMPAQVRKRKEAVFFVPKKSGNENAPEASYSHDLQQDSPACPRCGSEMIVRRATTGRFAGREFFGCSKFPRCKGIVNIVS
jgi:predicted RNA-binding Zn-ribbon protein involved in translation (DUF1610 family)